jgi:hypothetical protein
MDKRRVEIGRFEQAIRLVQEEYSNLQIAREDPGEGYAAVAKILKQPGLDFEVEINLQNCDELHLCASSFWVEWFPCGDEAVFMRFMDALRGLISGKYRIRESSIFGHVIKAELQKLDESGQWKTITSSLNLKAFLPWKRTIRNIQNQPVH